MEPTERQGSDPPGDTSLRRNARGNQVAASLFAAVLLLMASPLLWSAAGHEVHVALAAPLVGTTPASTPSASPSPSESATATPSPTATPLPATLTIVSPSSHSGPVGAHITVSGQNFAGSSAALYGTSNPSCGGAQTSLGSTQVSGGAVSTTFLWPASLNANVTYYICAAGVASPPGYHVLSASAPAVALNSTSVEVGKQVTISGTNFVGGSSQLTIAVKSASGTPTTITTQVPVGDDGSFNYLWTVAGAQGAVTILAESAQENGATPALQASAPLTILAAASPTVPASPSANSNGSGASNKDTGSASGVVIALIIGIVLLLLVILGVVAFLLLRGRGGPPGAGGYGDDGYPAGAYPGYAERNRVPANVVQGATGRQSAAGGYGQSGFYEPQAPYQGPAVGGVAQWDEPDATASTDWKPRPMSGYGPQYGQAGYDEGPTNPGAFAGDAGYGPADPWASQAGGYGALPPLNSNDGWGDGATQAADPAISPRPQTPPRKGMPPADPFAPRGPGDTNPAPRGDR